MKLKKKIDRILPTKRSKVLGIVLAGVVFGLAVYLMYASKFTSYLSDDPKACVNCHVMGPFYATWNHSSHARVATCNDCHVPHNNVFNKYFFKAKDGLRHTAVFTLRLEPQVMQAIPASSEVIMNNCIRCHTQLNQEAVKTGRVTYSEVTCGKGKACWDCHTEVPHRGKNSLSSTPHAIVPYPEGIVPEWLKKRMKSNKTGV
ncbi:cytochrome c nitrite reductase small subunit [Balneicella halophila]|uniref:Cytochrome c nitrite reductase small subunit n=1 Tax=Balneicella halophila TaxID=1537566 RepID=A0A7L4UPC5_BALHA|nr:cytochrome c nitrite reductase small subunit [Balneicella halophila]PVX51020.1 cytochrome c nitrite reductase small subunit [Balneicella halophila]